MTKNNILVVEDDISNYKLIYEILNNQETNITWAKNGKEAIQMVNKDICLILMDIKLPIITGIEATKIIRKKFPNIPIIAVTAYVKLKNDVMVKQCDEYITKPININYVVKLVNKYIIQKSKVF